jgi:hypothetical protein
MTAQELSKENRDAKRRVGKDTLTVHMDNAISPKWHKAQEHFPRKAITGIFHSVHSPDPSPCDSWFFGCAQERMKNQIITSEDDLEDRLTEVWETASRDLLESVFYQWISNWNVK